MIFSTSTTHFLTFCFLSNTPKNCVLIKQTNPIFLDVLQGLVLLWYRYNKLRKTFSKLYYRNLFLTSKYKYNMKSLLRQGISHPKCYGDGIYKLCKVLGHVYFENLFYKRIKSCLKIDYDPVILQRTSRLVIDPSTVDSHAFLFGCAMRDRV